MTSLIAVMSSPAAWSDRIAASLAGPGPLTLTSTLLTPKPKASFAHASPASEAAKGVLFLDPLNPTLPELDQATTLPRVSVIVIIVLLNVAWM